MSNVRQHGTVIRMSFSAAGLCRLRESWPRLPLVKAATAGWLLRPPLADVPTPGSQHYLDGQARWGAMEEGRWSEFLAWLDTSGLLHDQVLFVPSAIWEV